MRRKIWNIKELNPKIDLLAKKHNISKLLCQILLNRNINEDDFFSFLNPDWSNMHSCFLLPDMDRAVVRIKQAITDNENILIASDYDVDGVTSVAIFNDFIKDYPNFSVYIPHRVNDGYGLSKEAVELAKNKQASLIIAFDCGTNSAEEVELAKKYSIDVIVVDHHHPKNGLNLPFAFVNPKRSDCNYPSPDLSAAALSFKLLQALTGNDCCQTLDLVALSLVCDVVPLKGENRVLLKEGLKIIKQTKRPAIIELCKAAKIKQQNIDSFHIGYILGPRLNAAGRMAHAQDSLDMFISDDREKISGLANKLNEYNMARKNVEAQILEEAEAIINNNCNNDYAIVVAGCDWHPGVLGIVASRLADKYYRPSFVFSFNEDTARGSARSIRNVHLMNVLEKCAGQFCSYGGHSRAAGIEIAKDKLSHFDLTIKNFLKDNLKDEDLAPVIDIDCQVGFDELEDNLAAGIESLKPFGEENPYPLFVSRKVSKKSYPKKDRNGYLFWVTGAGRCFEAVVYDKDMVDIIGFADNFDIVYSIEKNSYHNNTRLIVKDVHLP